LVVWRVDCDELTFWLVGHVTSWLAATDPNHNTNPNWHSNRNIFYAHFLDTHKKIVPH